MDDLRRERGVADNVKIYLTVPVPFPFAGPPAAKLFKELLKEQNIEFLNNHSLTKIVDGSMHFEIVDGPEKGTTKVIDADLFLTTFPQRAPDFCQPLCNEKGFIDVYLSSNKVKSVKANDVYCIGDACLTFLKEGKPHPKAGEFAYMMGVHVADRIHASLNGVKSIPPPAREGSCVAECGVNGKGVNIRPNFTEVLASPETGMPKFTFPVVDHAAANKTAWVNGYLQKFFAQGKTPIFGESS